MIPLLRNIVWESEVLWGIWVGRPFLILPFEHLSLFKTLCGIEFMLFLTYCYYLAFYFKNSQQPVLSDVFAPWIFLLLLLQAFRQPHLLLPSEESVLWEGASVEGRSSSSVVLLPSWVRYRPLLSLCWRDSFQQWGMEDLHRQSRGMTSHPCKHWGSEERRPFVCSLLHSVPDLGSGWSSGKMAGSTRGPSNL